MALSSGKKELYQDALAWFDKAAAIDPQNVKLAYAMGHMFIYMQEHDQAIAKLEYALAQEQDSADVKEMLAMAYNGKAYSFYQAGENLEQGIELIDKAIALVPENGHILSTKAELLFKMKNYPEAHQFIKRAIALKPDEEEIKKDLAMIEEALQERKK